ncbi:MAG: universal stress protein [Magnetococcales bacterium]|nr:universal stress protein [Nitrospirota bacterium]
MSEIESCPISAVSNILLFTDGTQLSEGAISAALKLTSRCSGTMFVMGVAYENLDGDAFLPDHLEKMARKLEEHLVSVKARADALSVACEIILSHSDTPHHDIVEQVQRNKADLIVIGRRGYKGLLAFFTANIVADVIGSVTCKVLVVPKTSEFNGKTILVGVDGSKHSEAAAKEAVAIAKRLNSNIVILFSIHSEDERKYARYHVDMIAEMSAKKGVKAETLIPTGRSYKKILETVDEKGVDLIVVGSYGISGLKKLLRGSATEKLIEEAKCPVLVVNAEGQ